MKRRKKTGHTFAIFSILVLMPELAQTVDVWNGLGTNNNLNAPVNWSSMTVPTSSDPVYFDNTIPNINLTPAAISNFSVNSLNFPNSASAFSFIFNNSTFELAGPGIVSTNGSPTNTTITANNINNTIPLSRQIYFTNSGESVGSASLVVNNIGNRTVDNGIDLNIITNTPFDAPVLGPFTMSQGSQIAVINSGTDSSLSLGVGSNTTASVQGYQLFLAGPFNAENSCSLSVSNVGAMAGTSGGTNQVAIIQEPQLSVGVMTVGNAFSITVVNEGTDSNPTIASNLVGVGTDSNQLEFASLQAEDNLTITISNTGTNNGGGTGDRTGVIGFRQLYTPGNLTCGDFFTFNVKNTGINTNTNVAGNNYVGYISYPQVGLFSSTELFSLGNSASISIINEGTDTASGGGYTGCVGQQQCYLGPIVAGKDLTFAVKNSGNATGGVGNKNTGSVSSIQMHIDNSFTALSGATISVTNSGTFSGTSTATNNNIGYVSLSQLDIVGIFQVVDDFSLNVSNSGNDSSTGLGGNNIGVVGQNQAIFESSVSFGNNANFIVTNSGSSTLNSNNVGLVNGSQLVFDDAFSAGNNMMMVASNNGSGAAGTVLGPQITFSGTSALGDGSSIIAINEGGTLTSGQIIFGEGFTPTGKSSIQAINGGTLSGYGILIGGGPGAAGGDVSISLINSSLFIQNSNPTFTIGALNGDNNSTAQSIPQLVINLDAGVSATFAGSIEDVMGPSTLLITGFGTQTLSGMNTFTGLTTVDGPATLVLNGSLAGDLLVNGATLQGIGSANNATFNGGTISPGQSIGTLTFNSLTANGMTYDVEVTSTQNDLIDVLGLATINGGEVIVSSIDGTYNFGSKYTILEASTVTGQFSGVTAVAPFIQPVLSEDRQHIYLTVFPEFSRVAYTHNQRVVANQLDTILDPNALQNMLLNEISVLSIPEIRDALSNLSGWQYTSDLWIAENVGSEFNKRIYDNLRYIVTTDPDCYCACDDWTVWIEGGATFTSLHGDENAFGFSSRGADVSFGIQKTFSSDWTLGLAGSYEYNRINYKRDGGYGNYNTYLAGLYGLYRPSYFYVLADVSYGYSKNNVYRQMDVGTLLLDAQGKPNIQNVSFYGEIGADLNTNYFLIQPFVGLTAGGFWRERVKESGVSGWELDIHSQRISFVKSRVGVHLTATSLSFAEVSLDLAWAKRITGTDTNVDAQFIQFGNPFTIDSANINSNSIDYAFTLANCLNNYRFYIQVSGESWNRANNVNVVGGMQYSW